MQTLREKYIYTECVAFMQQIHPEKLWGKNEVNIKP